VLGKILHYTECCVAQCVVMMQPPIVDDGWTDTSNAFSESCEDFHVKNCINCLSRWYKLFVDDSMSIKKANEHGLLLGFAHSCFLGVWGRRGVPFCALSLTLRVVFKHPRLITGHYIVQKVGLLIHMMKKILADRFPVGLLLL